MVMGVLKNLPQVLYHSTHEDNLDSIIEHGLEPRGMDGLTYFADSFAGAVMFAYFHGVPLENVLVLMVHVDSLDKTRITEGRDHNPNFFKGVDVFAYPNIIPIRGIIDWLRVSKEGISDFNKKMQKRG